MWLEIDISKVMVKWIDFHSPILLDVFPWKRFENLFKVCINTFTMTTVCVRKANEGQIRM